MKGFNPRSSIRPLWLHTIEFNPDQEPIGAVVVVRRSSFDDTVGLLAFIASAPAHSSAVIHQTDGELWLKLTTREVLALHAKIGGMNHYTSPFGAENSDAYSALSLFSSLTDRG